MPLHTHFVRVAHATLATLTRARPVRQLRMERELSEIFDGRCVNLRTLEDLRRYFRVDVEKQAEVQYANAG